MINIQSTLGISTVTFVFLMFYAAWLFVIPFAAALSSCRDILPEPSCNYHIEFQKDSVYRFFLTSQSKAGWIIACFTVFFQLWITSIFIQAADQTAKINDWVYALSCPESSIECIDQRPDKTITWITFAGILAFFVIPYILDGFYLFYLSITSRKLDVKIFFGVLLASVPIMCIIVSCVYLRATSASSADLLKDSIAILFLSEIDEQAFKVVVRLFPSSMKKMEDEIVCNTNILNENNLSSMRNENNTVINVEKSNSVNELDGLNP